MHSPPLGIFNTSKMYLLTLIYGLFNDADAIWYYIASHGRTNEWWIGVIMEELGYSLNWGTDIAFAWKHERKPRKSSMSIFGVAIEFYMRAFRMQGKSLALELTWSMNTLLAPLRHTSQVQIFPLALCSSQKFAPLTDTVHQRLYYFFPLLCKADRFTDVLLFSSALLIIPCP